MSDLFGEIFLPHTLVNGATDLLKEFFPLYLPHIETLTGLGAGELKPPTNYTQRNTFTSIPGEELPKCVVLVPGLIGPPQKSGGNIYRATWRLGIGLAIAASTEEEAVFKAECYGAAARAILVHHPDINGVASKTLFVDEQYDDLPVASEIYKFRGAAIWFAVDVDNVVNKAPGPNSGNVFGSADKVVVQIDKS